MKGPFPQNESDESASEPPKFDLNDGLVWTCSVGKHNNIRLVVALDIKNETVEMYQRIDNPDGTFNETEHIRLNHEPFSECDFILWNEHFKYIFDGLQREVYKAMKKKSKILDRNGDKVAYSLNKKGYFSQNPLGNLFFNFDYNSNILPDHPSNREKW